MAAGRRILERRPEGGAAAVALGAARADRPPSSGGHVRLWLAAVVAATAMGTAGYLLGLGWSFWDSLYMTVISLTTVGFREVRELDTAGRIWTMVVTVAGVAIIFGGVGIMAESLFNAASTGERDRRRMRDAIGALRGHFVVCGYGRVGSTVARHLAQSGQAIVVIDVNNASLVAAWNDGHIVVEGDATADATLRAAGLERARGLVSVMDSDVGNVYVTLSARNLNPNLVIVARASAEETESKLIQAGADRVVSPYTRAGRHMAELAIRPQVADFLDAALSHGELAFGIEELLVAEGGPLVGTSVGELQKDGIHVLAIVRGDRQFEANPPSERRLAAHDSLILSGAQEPLQRLHERA